jgi:hypothetical protein
MADSLDKDFWETHWHQANDHGVGLELCNVSYCAHSSTGGRWIQVPSTHELRGRTVSTGSMRTSGAHLTEPHPHRPWSSHERRSDRVIENGRSAYGSTPNHANTTTTVRVHQ